MIIIQYTKITRQDPDSASGSYVDHVLSKDAVLCCDKFREYSKKFPSWDYGKGKFTTVDEITYDGHSQTPIDFCPFCGEKMKYKEIKLKNKNVKSTS